MNARLTFVHALSPLHAGTGQGAGVIDLPIAREKATGLPFLPGSSLKGALRTRCNTAGRSQNCKELFGSDNPDDMKNTPSQVQFSDQRLLLLPMRSLAGTFAWVTSPYALRRLVRDMADVQSASPSDPIPAPDQIDRCYIPEGDSDIQFGDNKVYLEDLKFQAQKREEITQWAQFIGQHVFAAQSDWQQMLKKRLCLVHDDVFNFMIDTATEVITRIKLQDDSKTVQDGGLWYEEALPTETILSGIALATPIKSTAMTAEQIFQEIDDLTRTTIQLGGKATIGRGMCRVYLAGERA